jgi:hypothetical protein
VSWCIVFRSLLGSGRVSLSIGRQLHHRMDAAAASGGGSFGYGPQGNKAQGIQARADLACPHTQTLF